jgi:hypothetical protein
MCGLVVSAALFSGHKNRTENLLRRAFGILKLPQFCWNDQRNLGASRSTWL